MKILFVEIKNLIPFESPPYNSPDEKTLQFNCDMFIQETGQAPYPTPPGRINYTPFVNMYTLLGLKKTSLQIRSDISDQLVTYLAGLSPAITGIDDVMVTGEPQFL